MDKKIINHSSVIPDVQGYLYLWLVITETVCVMSFTTEMSSVEEYFQFMSHTWAYCECSDRMCSSVMSSDEDKK